MADSVTLFLALIVMILAGTPIEA